MRVLFGLCLAALAACGDVAPDPNDRASDTDVTGMTLGQSASGREVTVQVGGRFSLELQSIPTAGYIWQITETPDGLVLVGEGVRPTDPERQNQPGFTGGNHWMDFTFEAQKPFTGALVLVEARPWELLAGDPPDDEFRLIVTAED